MIACFSWFLSLQQVPSGTPSPTNRLWIPRIDFVRRQVGQNSAWTDAEESAQVHYTRAECNTRVPTYRKELPQWSVLGGGDICLQYYEQVS